jgi:1-acyl-sn-glycerol-3-phosphate acyltransferase
VRRGRLGFWLRLAVILLKPLVIVLTRQRWSGREHIPLAGGVVVASNHLSHADPLTLSHFVWAAGRSPRFLAKASLFGLPLLGRLLRGAGQIPVLRESDAAGSAYLAAVEAVRCGEAVCIYPEGTLTRDPDLWPMAGKTGAARVALATGAPVIPLAQWGPQQILPPYSRRPRLWPPTTVHLLAGPPVDLTEFSGREPTPELMREATERIIDAIADLLAGLRGERPPAVRFDPRVSSLPRTGDPRRGREELA